ncbi:beta-lactamase superfamily protein [Ceratobasidium sp. AG-Ba]|nr:beta-lactamase superfamily protein [Ceratobasidium sp. AG-Ba]QRV91809.1 beta-lactamase superfamily protein [Ceratobasidium sp. AG-Ba]
MAIASNGSGSLHGHCTPDAADPGTKRLDIFGPRGLRELLRMSLKLTETVLVGKYAVHEFLFPKDGPCIHGQSDPHPNEVTGKDLVQSTDGFWTDFETHTGWAEPPRAAPFDSGAHFEPLDRNADALATQGVRNPRSLLGQLLRSRKAITLPDGTLLEPPVLIPGRKLVILGDTSDPWAIKDMAMDASLLVHEATNAYIPLSIDPKSPKTDTEANVKERALKRGHSTPTMAGEFASAIRARRLVLNHFSSRFSAPGGLSSTSHEKLAPSAPLDARAEVMKEIERQASQAWGGGQAIAAYDLMCLDLSS